jgi:hypothetical protein
VAVVEQSVVLLAPVSTTVAPGVTVPDTVGVKLVRMFRGATIFTVGGVSAVKLVTLGVLVPPALVAIAVIELTPVGTVTAQLKLPPAVTVVEHSVVPTGPVMVTRLPGVAVPDTVGLRLVCILLGDWMLIVGTATAVNVVTSVALTPPRLVEIAEIEFTPAATVTTHE